MKTLILVRHAKSSWKDSSLADIDRPLNKRGKRDAPFMGALMKKENILPDLLLSSPAKRACTTAKIFAEELGLKKIDVVTDEQIYLSSASELIDVINEIEDKYNKVMMFGHNPGFTTLNNYLTDHYVDNIPTCGISVIEFDLNSWQDVSAGTGKLVQYEYPKKCFSK